MRDTSSDAPRRYDQNTETKKTNRPTTKGLDHKETHMPSIDDMALVMGVDLDEQDRLVEEENARRKREYLEEFSFEEHIPQELVCDETCTIALLVKTEYRTRGGLFLNALERDGIPFEKLNDRRGRPLPESNMTVEDARELAWSVAQTIGLDDDYEELDFESPTIVRVRMRAKDLLPIYKRALTEPSAAYDNYIQIRKTERTRPTIDDYYDPPETNDPDDMIQDWMFEEVD